MGLLGNSATLKSYSTPFWITWFLEMAIFALFMQKNQQNKAKMAISRSQVIQKEVE